MAMRIIPSVSLQQGPARFADFQPYELGVLDATFVGNQKAAIGRYIERPLVAGGSSERAGRAPDHPLFGACQCRASARRFEANKSVFGMRRDVYRSGHPQREVVALQMRCRYFDMAGRPIR